MTSINKVATIAIACFFSSSYLLATPTNNELDQWKNLRSQTIWDFTISSEAKTYEALLGFANSSPNCGVVIIDYLSAKNCTDNLNAISEKELFDIIDKTDSPENKMLVELHDIRYSEIGDAEMSFKAIEKYKILLKTFRALNCANLNLIK